MIGAFRLRALLIQKDAKPGQAVRTLTDCLRALLIQKDAKQERSDGTQY